MKNIIIFFCFIIRFVSASDDLIDISLSPDGSYHLIYNWKDPATIYSVTMKKGDTLFPGRQIAVLKIKKVNQEERSKAHITLAESFLVGDLFIKLGQTVQHGDLLATLHPIAITHDSKRSSQSHSMGSLKTLFLKLWKNTGIQAIISQTKNDWTLGVGRLLMILIGLLLLYLAVFKHFEPLLLVPIGFGSILSNIPIANISGPDGLLGLIYTIGVETGVFPLIIFMGVGAMTDFGPLIANPITAILGAAAQAGIFLALIGALFLSHYIPGIEFGLKEAASIGIIGGADGPTAIFLTSQLSPHLLGSIAVSAYSYMALVPIIQPPIMKLLTTKKERQIKMVQLRPVSRIEKMGFSLLITLLCAALLPDAAPLIGMLMFGNFMRECGVVERLSQTTQHALINIVTIMLGLAVGSKLSADKFLNLETVGILILGLVAFSVGTTAGILLGKLMALKSKGKINPLIGAAGVSAVPMAARVVNKVGLKNDPQNFLLMHAMGPNVAGVIGSAVAAGVLLNALN